MLIKFKSSHRVVLLLVAILATTATFFLINDQTQAGKACDWLNICGVVRNESSQYVNVKDLGTNQCTGVAPGGTSTSFTADADSFGGTSTPIDVYHTSMTGWQYVASVYHGQYYKISDGQSATCYGPSNGRLTCYVWGPGSQNDIRNNFCN